jgi:polysaccharide deacetylase family protein (PEP-CTERM system associated)
VEDYFQVSAFERDIDRANWGDYLSRVVANTLRLLETLADRQIRATFFVVGWVAEKHPDLVAAIHDAGHEIGSHSYWHRLVYQLSPDEFRRDLTRSRQVLEDTIGQPVQLFRAPSFSITRKSLWALDILVEEGFTVDSSVFPVHHDRYGVPHARPFIHRLSTASGEIWECPPSVVRYVGLNIPVSGGGYFRLYPGSLSRYWLRRINHDTGQPFVFYVHPWELDPQQPRLKAGSRLSRWRHYLNLGATEEKLRRLLSEFRFGSLGQVLAATMDNARHSPGPLMGTRPPIHKAI